MFPKKKRIIVRKILAGQNAIRGMVVKHFDLRFFIVGFPLEPGQSERREEHVPAN
jgi:hypothetical protein